MKLCIIQVKQGAMMKIKLFYLMIFVLVLIIAACGNELHSDLQKYKREMKPIYKKRIQFLKI